MPLLCFRLAFFGGKRGLLVGKHQRGKSTGFLMQLFLRRSQAAPPPKAEQHEGNVKRNCKKLIK